MAALTWRDVVAPNFSGANEAYRLAGAQMNQALGGLSDTLGKFQADRKAAVDNSTLARIARYQDPDQLRAELTSGSLDLRGASPEVIGSVNKQIASLLGQAAAEQNIASSQLGDERTRQTMGNEAYAQERQERNDGISDAARVDAARLFGSTGAIANMSVEDQQDIAAGLSSLQTAQLGRASTNLDMRAKNFNYSTAVRNDQEDRESTRIANEMLTNYATTDGMRNAMDLSNTPPNIAEAVRKKVESATGARVYTPVTVDPEAPVSSSPLAEEALFEINRRITQNTPSNVIADIEDNIPRSKESPGDVANRIIKAYPGLEFAQVVNQINEGRKGNPDLSPADAGSALVSAIVEQNWYDLSTSNVGGGLAVGDSAYAEGLKSMATGKADIASAGNRQLRREAAAIKAADARVSRAAQLYRAVGNRPGASSLIPGEELLQAEDTLARLLARQQKNPQLRPEYEPTNDEVRERIIRGGR